MSWTVHFFDDGVMEHIQRWPLGIKAKFTWIVELIEQQGPREIGMPYIRALGEGLFEIRAQGKEGIGRAIFCMLMNQRVLILNGFIKKTASTPRREISLALKRMMGVKKDEKKT